MRLKNSSVPTGKSGGFRVVYYYVDEENNLYLMAMYSKTELENISDERITEILKTYNLWYWQKIELGLKALLSL